MGHVFIAPCVTETGARPAVAGSGDRCSSTTRDDYARRVASKALPHQRGTVLRYGARVGTKVIESGSNRRKTHHYQLMKKQPPKRPYRLKAT